MKFIRLPDSIRAAPFAVAFLLCVAVLLCAYQFAGYAANIGGSPGLVAGHSSHSGSMGTTGDNMPASLEEVEAAGEDLLNAQSLTAMLLTVFFGAVLGLLFGGRKWRRNEALLLSERRLASIITHLPPRPASSRLSVFLL